jgi:hypothetical protein
MERRKFKNLSKNGSAHKGGSLSDGKPFLKKIFGVGRDSAVGANAARRAAAASEPKAPPCPLTVRAHHGARPCWRKSTY